MTQLLLDAAKPADQVLVASEPVEVLTATHALPDPRAGAAIAEDLSYLALGACLLVSNLWFFLSVSQFT